MGWTRTGFTGGDTATRGAAHAAGTPGAPLRRFLVSFFLLAGALAVNGPAGAGGLAKVRAGVLTFGTVNWELDVIRHHGLDRKEGVELEVVGLGGKTTLLNIISGLDALVEGEVPVAGRAPADGPLTGYMFQSPRLMPWLSVRDNVRLVLGDDALSDGRTEPCCGRWAWATSWTPFPTACPAAWSAASPWPAPS